jgi:hypothetical protein
MRELEDCLGRSLHMDLHGSGLQVAHPSRQSQALGVAQSKITETDSLNPALDQKAPGSKRAQACFMGCCQSPASSLDIGE